MELLSLILNFILGTGLAGTLLFFRPKRREAKAHADNAEIENTEKIIHLQSEHIGRLDGRVEKLEEKVDKLEIIIEKKDSEIECKQLIIRQAYKCSTPADQCPVLIMKTEKEKKLKEKPHESEN